MSFFFNLIIALALTVCIEFAVYLALTGRDAKSLLFYSLLINSFTNPLLNYLYNYVYDGLYLLEAIVIAVESLLIMLLLRLDYGRSLLVSAVANLTTLLVGYIIFF